MDSNFKNELENLSEKSKNIKNVLKNTKETFEKYFDDRFKDDYSCLNLNTFPDLRLDNLDKLLTRLKSCLKLTSPCVDQANEMVSKLNLLNNNVSLIKEKMKNVSVSSDILQLCDMEDLINDNYIKLKCVEKLQFHLDPSMFTYINVDLEIEEDNEKVEKELVKIIQSAEKLKLSRKLCHSLKNIEELSQSISLSEALKRIDSNFDLASQMCYLWLNKQIKKLSLLSSRLSSDYGIINEPLINISEKDDRIGITSIFETSSSDPNYSIDRYDNNNNNYDNNKNKEDKENNNAKQDKEYGDMYVNDTDNNEQKNEVVDNRNISIRILKILITNPKNLQKILQDLNGFLSNLSIRRFYSLLQYIKLDLKYKNNAIYDVFMNLQLVLSLIKSCVLSLYYNCELDLYVNPYPYLDIMTAPKYIDKITFGLVAPLEHKLDQILNTNSGNESNMDNFSNTNNISMDYMNMGLESKSNHISSNNRLNNDNKLNNTNFSNNRFHNYNSNSITNNRYGNNNYNNNNNYIDNVYDNNDLQDKGCGDIYVSDILDLYTALQICHFYYKKISKILKPPYLYTHYGSIDSVDDTDYTYTEYVLEDNPVLISFSGLCEKWKDMILSKLQHNITLPLSTNEFSKKLDSYQVVETISNFLSEIVSIQLEYSSSDDLLMILEMTLNPVINWCQKVSNELDKESSNYFLIRSFSSLLNSIQSPQVNKSFKSLLEELIDNNVDIVSLNLINNVLSRLGGGQLIDHSTFNVEYINDDFLEKIRNLIYTDSLKEHVTETLAKTLNSLGTTNYKLVVRRVYVFLAGVYKQHSKDKKLSDELLTLASTYE